jgi:4-amino-4-deoxy-L-arabinose transferase-like glycosyltransferase
VVKYGVEFVKDDEERMIEEKPQEAKWYFKTSWIVTAFLCVGPLALPLVLLNPRLSRKTKTIVTIITIILSWCLGVLLINSLKSLKEYYGIIFGDISGVAF